MKSLLTSLFLVSCLLALPGAEAHGDVPSLEKVVDGYLIDIGYNPTAIMPNKPITFDFDLFTDADASDFADFSSVTVEVAHEGVTIFDQTLTNDGVNVPTTAITFPDEGLYTMHVTYTENSDQIVYTTFEIPVDVLQATLSKTKKISLLVVAGILVLAGAATIVQSFRKRA